LTQASDQSIETVRELPEFFFQNSELKMPFLNLPLRSTGVILSSETVLISPIRCVKDLSIHYSVTQLISPNLFHWIYLKKAKEVFPEAKIWALSGLHRKTQKINPDYFLDKDFWPFGEELSLHWIMGMPKFNEFVFFHKKSKTLIVTDLFFNLSGHFSFIESLILRALGTYQRFAVSKLFLTQVKDRKKFQESLNNILEIDFENIVMAHGNKVIGNGKALVKSTLMASGLI